MAKILDFYKDKRILITGHTGFKGSWLCRVLIMAGAEVSGYALEPASKPNLFELCQLENKMNSIIGDIRDLACLKKVFEKVKPEIVIHMAAQPLVRESYRNPVYTYETNVLGTVNVLECVRLTSSVKSMINVTTDKVYFNREWEWGYRENDELNGFDPYSNSKSCSELVTSSYVKAFFKERDIAVTTCRAGNVIGGGDFAEDRIIPDCVRAVMKKQNILVRNPYAVRPYEHVLEPLMAYLLIAQEQYNNKMIAGNYNIGPEESDCCTNGELVTLFCEQWNLVSKEKVYWQSCGENGPHEANFLKLDCSKLKSVMGWRPVWNIGTAIGKVVEWMKVYIKKEDVAVCMDCQIKEFLQDMNQHSEW